MDNVTASSNIAGNGLEAVDRDRVPATKHLYCKRDEVDLYGATPV
jgi:hypothetical protein